MAKTEGAIEAKEGGIDPQRGDRTYGWDTKIDKTLRRKSETANHDDGCSRCKTPRYEATAAETGTGSTAIQTAAEAGAVLPEGRSCEKREKAEPDDSFHGRPSWA